MIGVRDRAAVIDLTVERRSTASGEDRQAINQALLFANGTDERGRRLALAFDGVPQRLRPETRARFQDRRMAAIYATADLDDGAPNVRLIGASESVVRSAVHDDGPDDQRRSRRPDQGRGSGRDGSRRVEASVVHAVAGANALAAQPHPDQRPVARPRPAARADLRVVARPTSMWGRRLTAVFWSSFILGVLFLAVVLHATLAQRQGVLDDTHLQLERAERDHERLRVQVAELESPQRITALAARMGLVTPERIRFVTPQVPVSESTSAGR